MNLGWTNQKNHQLGMKNTENIYLGGTNPKNSNLGGTQIRKTSIWEEPNFGIWTLDENHFFEPNMASPGQATMLKRRARFVRSFSRA